MDRYFVLMIIFIYIFSKQLSISIVLFLLFLHLHTGLIQYCKVLLSCHYLLSTNPSICFNSLSIIISCWLLVILFSHSFSNLQGTLLKSSGLLWPYECLLYILPQILSDNFFFSLKNIWRPFPQYFGSQDFLSSGIIFTSFSELLSSILSSAQFSSLIVSHSLVCKLNILIIGLLLFSQNLKSTDMLIQSKDVFYHQIFYCVFSAYHTTPIYKGMPNDRSNKILPRTGRGKTKEQTIICKRLSNKINFRYLLRRFGT